MYARGHGQGGGFGGLAPQMRDSAQKKLSKLAPQICQI